MRRIWPPVLGAIGVLVILPFAVLVGAASGVPTTHWSGVSLGGVALLPAMGSIGQSGPDLDAARMAHLERVMHDAVPLPGHDDVVMTYISFRRGQVVVGTSSLSHGLFGDLSRRYGDDVTVSYEPWAQPMSLLEAGGARPPSWFSRHEPLATWFTLVTGFPWYLGAAVLLEAAALVLWRRRRRPAQA
jgi:hypothetical protein